MCVVSMIVDTFGAATGQPDCEKEEKVALIKRLAEIVGVDMSDVFETENK